MTAPLHPSEELSNLLANTRALLELYQDSGTLAIPSEGQLFQVSSNQSTSETNGNEVNEVSSYDPLDPPLSSHSPQPILVEPRIIAAEIAQASAKTAAQNVQPTTRSPVRIPGVSVPATFEERVVRLQTMSSQIASCTACKLHSTRTQTVFSRGSAKTELFFVGEGPGADEDRLGEPFVGAAGQLLDRMIGAMGFARDEVYIANIVKCRPPGNRTPEQEEIDACVDYLHEQIALVSPRVIVALGATAIKGLLGIGGIMRIRGQWKLYRASVPVMPTFHPAYLLRNAEAKKDVWQDLQAVVKKLGRELPKRRPQ